MANTNSQGAQFRPLKINYGAIVQEHIRYMRKYKDEKEAKEYSRMAKEREFKAKLEQKREKDLIKFDIGEVEGYLSDGIIESFEKKRDFLSETRQKYIKTGELKYANLYEKISTQYKNGKKLPLMFTEYAKSLKKDFDAGNYNEYLDKAERELGLDLSKANFLVDGTNIKIPYESGYTKLFGLEDSEVTDDGYISISFNKLASKLEYNKNYSGKHLFKETGEDVVEKIKFNNYDTNIGVSEKDRERVERQSIEYWKNSLLGNGIQYKSALAKYGQEQKLSSDGKLDMSQITDLAIKLNRDFTPKRKIIDNSDNIRRKNQAINRAGRSSVNSKPDSDLTIITTGILNEDNSYLQSIVSPEGKVGGSGNVVMAEYTLDEDGDKIVRMIWNAKGKTNKKVDIKLKDPAFIMKMASYIKPKSSIPSLRKELREGSSEGVVYNPSEITKDSKIAYIVQGSKLKKAINGDSDAEGEDLKPLSELSTEKKINRLNEAFNLGVKIKKTYWGDNLLVFPDGTEIKESDSEAIKSIIEKSLKVKKEDTPSGKGKPSEGLTEAKKFGI